MLTPVQQYILKKAGIDSLQSEPSKISKAEAQYTDKAGGDNRCGNCAWFVEPDACRQVEGLINEDGWCKYHEPENNPGSDKPMDPELDKKDD